MWLVLWVIYKSYNVLESVHYRIQNLKETKRFLKMFRLSLTHLYYHFVGSLSFDSLNITYVNFYLYICTYMSNMSIFYMISQ